MLTSWTADTTETVTRRQLDARAGRRLTDTEVGTLEAMRAIRREGARFEALPSFELAVEILALGLPVDSLVAASEAINGHMEALADELTEILRSGVLAPYREQSPTEADKARFEQTVSRLRQLTLEAVVAGFQRAANQVISRSLS